MTPNGQIAIPLDKAAIREPFLTSYSDQRFLSGLPPAMVVFCRSQPRPTSKNLQETGRSIKTSRTMDLANKRTFAATRKCFGNLSYQF
jgi:hypothetical protein